MKSRFILVACLLAIATISEAQSNNSTPASNSSTSTASVNVSNIYWLSWVVPVSGADTIKHAQNKMLPGASQPANSGNPNSSNNPVKQPEPADSTSATPK